MVDQFLSLETTTLPEIISLNDKILAFQMTWSLIMMIIKTEHTLQYFLNRLNKSEKKKKKKIYLIQYEY